MLDPYDRGGETVRNGDRHGLPLGTASSFSVGRAGGTVLVTVEGEVAMDDWSRLDVVLRDLIDAQGNLDVVLDLCDVSHLDRSAVPLIVRAARQAHSHGGRLRLADRACHDCAWLMSARATGT